MNIRPNLHNVAIIVGVAVLGLVAFKLASRTRAASLPVVGDVIRFGAAA